MLFQGFSYDEQENNREAPHKEQIDEHDVLRTLPVGNSQEWPAQDDQKQAEQE